MSLLRLDASIRVEGSHSRAIADLVEQEWRDADPQEPIIRRPIGVDPVAATAWATAVSGGQAPEESRTPEQVAALALAAQLTDELVAADALMFAVRLYNFGVSEHFKAWVDVVITDPRMAAGSEAILAGRPAVLVVARGQPCRRNPPGRLGPRDRLDAPHPRRRVAVRPPRRRGGVHSIGVNPALDQFKGLARSMREQTDRQARKHGRELAVTTDPAQAPAA